MVRAKGAFNTLNLEPISVAIWLLVIFLSPTEDSKSHSRSGIDLNPYQIWSEGGGFTCIRKVPRTDEILIARESGTYSGRKCIIHVKYFWWYRDIMRLTNLRDMISYRMQYIFPSWYIRWGPSSALRLSWYICYKSIVQLHSWSKSKFDAYVFCPFPFFSQLSIF